MQSRWQAVDDKGAKHMGLLTADSPRHARQLLRDKQLQPLSLKPSMQRSRRGSIKNRDFVLMMRQLATLSSAGLPLAQSLQALASQSEKQQQRQLLQTLHQKVLTGSSLAEAVAEFPTTFTVLYRAMIAAGEASGKLGSVLEQLADYSEKAQQLKGKLLQAMIYPMLLTCVAFSVVMILLTAVVPEVVAQFSHMQQNLPATTRLLMTLSEAAQAYGWLLIALFALGLLAFRTALKKPELRFRWHQRSLGLPGTGRSMLDLNLPRYSRTLSILTSSAVPLLEGMTISASVLSNDYIRQQLCLAAGHVREGMALAQALDETRLLSPMMSHMIASGERSGNLIQMLAHTADNQERDFRNQMTIAVSLFEPLLIVVMAAVVLFIILAILQPILQLNSLTG